MHSTPKVAFVTGVSRRIGIGAAIAQARQRFGHIDILVNNATHDEVADLEAMDAARLIRFLASDDAEWITGQLIRSRGGLF
jgi:NAD(P)-dependent dehydrogenase (short-subunit alcohol dehydrogenase family)